jgi:PAS domain S-box-containing protein
MSQFSFIGLIDETESLMTIHVWSKNTMAQCSSVDKPIHFPIAEAGAWGDCVRQREAVTINDYDAPRHGGKGYPEGHVPIRRFLGVPVFDGNKIVAVAAVANKEEPYGEDDVSALTSLVNKMWEILRRKQAEEALHAANAYNRSLIEASLDPLVTIGADGKITDVNAATETATGYDRTELIGTEFSDYFTEPKQARAGYQEVFRTGFVRDHPLELRHRDGQVTSVLYNASVYRYDKGRIAGVFAAARDITERKRVEEELRASRLQLRALASRLQQIREDERIMIAREIHDEMGGGLTGLKMDLSWLLHKMGNNADLDEARATWTDKIHAANASIDQMIRVVRRISTDLRPSVLDDLGLIAALEWQLAEFTSRNDIQHKFATTFEYVNMEEGTAVAVFRIFQEALTNVARHSRATKVTVVLREGERRLFGDESFILEIRDNGRGITEEEILNPESLGLLGMKERVLTFGGELSIHGEPGGGTTLVLKIPLKQGELS